MHEVGDSYSNKVPPTSNQWEINNQKQKKNRVHACEITTFCLTLADNSLYRTPSLILEAVMSVSPPSPHFQSLIKKDKNADVWLHSMFQYVNNLSDSNKSFQNLVQHLLIWSIALKNFTQLILFLTCFQQSVIVSACVCHSSVRWGVLVYRVTCLSALYSVVQSLGSGKVWY